MAEADPMLRRIERWSIMACVTMAVAAWAFTRGGWAYPLGVIGGGVLVAISYRGIKAGIDVLVAASRPAGVGQGRRAAVVGLVKFFTRYAILAVAAYVIMARLRLPPVAVIAGASSLVVAVTLEAVRPHRKEPPHNVD